MSNAVKEFVPVIKKRRTTLANEQWRRAKRMGLLYALFAVPMILFIIFHYIPIYGIIIAFKDFRISLGFWRSPWNNFEHFRLLFQNPFFYRILRNTLVISVLRILLGFPAPIILALLINEIGNMGFKKAIQSISYLPHFMSWVVIAGIIMEILSPQRGIVAYFSLLSGKPAPNMLTSTQFFVPMLIASGIWKGVGWGSIIYLASITSIDPQLYESASIDGASRFQMAIKITIPSLIPVMVIIFILSLGRILNAGFDQIFNLYNPSVYEVADIIDTFVYRIGLVERRYDFAMAVGVFKSFIGLLLILGANAIIKRFSEYGIW